MSEGKTILLLERDTSLRRLLAVGLQHRGMHVIEADSIPSCDQQSLDMLILDVDDGIESNWSLLATAQAHPHLSMLPTIILAWECLVVQHTSVATTMTQTTEVTCLTKPFDARILYNIIEHLLVSSTAREAANIARMEAKLQATHTSPPSIWPVITAVGLLIAFIGMMLHVAFIIVGILIALIALLFWMLGTKPEQSTTAIV